MLKRIEEMTEQDEFVDVKYKEKSQKYLLVGFIGDENLAKIKDEVVKDQHCAMVLFNTKENLDFVINNWNDFIKNRKLSIMFINPFSKTDKLWSVYPATHNFISEGKAIKAGLNVLFSNVEETTEEELRKIIES